MKWAAIMAFLLIAYATASAAAPAAPSPVYAVRAPAPAPPTYGWGADAIDRGRSLDLRARDLGWSEDPGAAGELAVGLGWRHYGASAMVGLTVRARPSQAPDQLFLHRPPPPGPGGVLGLTLSIPTR